MKINALKVVHFGPFGLIPVFVCPAYDMNTVPDVFSIYVPFLISRVHPALRICPVIAYKKKMCIFVLFVPCYENTAVMYNYY